MKFQQELEYRMAMRKKYGMAAERLQAIKNACLQAADMEQCEVLYEFHGGVSYVIDMTEMIHDELGLKVQVQRSQSGTIPNVIRISW